MKLNVTSSIINSPSLENCFLCTHLAVETEHHSMIVNCTSEEWDVKPVNRLDRERCPWYGQWEACFYIHGEEQPKLRIELGDTLLENGNMGIEIFGAEGLSKDTAISVIINAVLWRLLQSPNYERTPAVVLSDYIEWATWLMRSGVQHGKKEGDFKVSRFFTGMGVERTYNYGAGSGLKVKQTLVTYTHEHNRRETQLFFPTDHLYVASDEFVKDPERYVNSLKRPAVNSPVLRIDAPARVRVEINPMIELLRSLGYSSELVDKLIDETNEKIDAWVAANEATQAALKTPIGK